MKSFSKRAQTSRSRWVLVPAVAAVLALSGCATTTSTGAGAGPAAGAASAGGGSLTPKDLVTRMQAASAKATSATGELTITGSAAANGSFTETLRDGKAVAVDMKMSMQASGQDLDFEMRLVDGKIYLGGGLLEQLGAGGKEWALASSQSSNAALRTMATQMGSYLDSATAAQYSTYAEAATAVRDQGTTTIGSIPAHRYELTVDVAALQKSLGDSSNAESMSALTSAGVKTLPVSLALDSSDRVVDATINITVGSTTVDTDFRITAYDSPVTITAPDDADVYSG